MKCIICESKNVTCIDDILQINYIAEVYKCDICEGIIEVEYNNSISMNDIKTYKYIRKSVSVD